jgi:hypothetical protein
LIRHDQHCLPGLNRILGEVQWVGDHELSVSWRHPPAAPADIRAAKRLTASPPLAYDNSHSRWPARRTRQLEDTTAHVLTPVSSHRAPRRGGGGTPPAPLPAQPASRAPPSGSAQPDDAQEQCCVPWPQTAAHPCQRTATYEQPEDRYPPSTVSRRLVWDLQ